MDRLPAFLVRIWIGGDLVVRDEVSDGNLSECLKNHLDSVERARVEGKEWMVEISDPAEDLNPIRFGTDKGGMIEPKPIDLKDLVDEAAKVI